MTKSTTPEKSRSNTRSRRRLLTMMTGATLSLVLLTSSPAMAAEASVSGSISWTSPKARVGSSYKAWAVGEHVTYQIQKWNVAKAGGRTARTLLSTSATLTAFEPVKGFAVGQ